MGLNIGISEQDKLGGDNEKRNFKIGEKSEDHKKETISKKI